MNTEEEYEQAQQSLREVEKRRNRVQIGLPAEEPEAVENDVQAVNVVIDNTRMREYFLKVNEQFQTVFAMMQRSHETKVSEAVKLFESELQIVSERLKELIDNFNLYVAEERKNRVAYRKRVEDTCAKIDKELAY